MSEFDVLVIGAGPPGENAAGRAVDRRGDRGGSCLMSSLGSQLTKAMRVPVSR